MNNGSFIFYKVILNLLKAGRIAVKLPKITEIVNTSVINCPPVGLLNDYTRCEINLSAGTNLNVTIDYGDGSAPQNFIPTGIYINLTLKFLNYLETYPDLVFNSNKMQNLNNFALKNKKIINSQCKNPI